MALRALASVRAHREVIILRSAIAASVFASLTACASARRAPLEPLVTDRPDFTESSQTIPRGLVQLEAGSTFTRTPDERSTSVGEVLVRAGISDAAELRIGLNSYAFSRAEGSTVRGLEDAELGVKVRLLKGGATGSPRPTIAVIVGSSLPTGSRAFGSSKWQPAAKLGAEWDMSERVSLATNVNYSWLGDRRNSWGEPAASASLGVALSETIGSYLEYFGFYPQYRGAERSHFGNVGLTYAFTDDFQVDARGGHGFQRASGGPNFFFGLGIARRW